jgi:excinuclease ABC subunit C
MIREGKMVGVNQVPLYDLDLDLKEAEILFEFLIQYYLNIYENSTSLIPSKILVPEILLDYKSDLKNLESALGGRARHSFIFPNTEKEFELLSMLKKTSDQKLVEISSKKVSVLDDLIDVQKKLKLKKLPVRMECYDISHFQGEAKVASRVVFINGVPEKTLYRHYHVKTVEGIDDFKSLEEVLRRRFENDLTKPDFVLIDGGIGQLNKVQAVFEELGVSGVELFSIAKARTSSSFSKKEIVSTDERIFRVNQKNPIILRPNTGAYRILTSLRDEAHRFAIEFHRKVFEDKKIKKP